MKIIYSTPFNTSKNIGKALNDFCEIVPEDAWIVLRDMDTLPLCPEFGKQVEQVIMNNNGYDLISCMTNRLNVSDQLHNNGISDNMDILHHIEISKQRWDEHGALVKEAKLVAGLCLIFRKSLWNRIMFTENCLHFDKIFSQSVLKEGGKIGIAKGLYLFHIYRIWVKHNPQFHKSHLM